MQLDYWAVISSKSSWRAVRPCAFLVRKDSDTRLLDSWKVEKACGDVTDAQSLQAAMKGVQTVYHAAAQVGDWGKWERFVAVSIEGTRNMLAAAREAKVRRFLQIGSISTYGHPDGEGLVLDETAPLGANLHKWSYYSRAKVQAVQLAWEAHKRGEVPVTVVNPSWLYGPRDRAVHAATDPRSARARARSSATGPTAST